MTNEMMLDQEIPNIIIVDDVPANLKILGNILKFEGYKVRPVPNGIMALKVAEMEKPDAKVDTKAVPPPTSPKQSGR